jgi:hypothetical protein
MISCKFGNEDDGQLVPKPVVSSLPTNVLLHQSNADFQTSYDILLSKSHESKDAGEGVNLWHINHLEKSCNLLDEYDIILHLFEDPFAVFLESVSSPKFPYFVKFEFGCKCSNELPFYFQDFVFPKNIPYLQLVKLLLEWILWKSSYT